MQLFRLKTNYDFYLVCLFLLAIFRKASPYLKGEVAALWGTPKSPNISGLFGERKCQP